MVLRIPHASLTSTRWPATPRLLIGRPMIVLYLQTAFSTAPRYGAWRGRPGRVCVQRQCERPANRGTASRSTTRPERRRSPGPPTRGRWPGSVGSGDGRPPAADSSTRSARCTGPSSWAIRSRPAGSPQTTATFTQLTGGSELKRHSHSSPPSRPIHTWPVVVPRYSAGLFSSSMSIASRRMVK
jgi:hypothetical protein